MPLKRRLGRSKVEMSGHLVEEDGLPRKMYMA
jgi:hypothetical protein